jgi:hypothetical protein
MYTISRCTIKHSYYDGERVECISCNIELDLNDHFLIQKGNDVWAVCNEEICINMCVLQRSLNV